ncbi:MAG TPA: serine protease, partial [Myxococcota bacterium]|nr:serine protease [Myxococcota bacterium]
ETVIGTGATSTTGPTTTTIDSFEVCPEGDAAATIEVLPAVDFDLTEVVTGAGSAPLAELQAAADAILKHIMPSLLGDREATASSLLASLATVLDTSRNVADSQQIRDALADWIHRISDLVGEPVLDALRAESASAAPATAATTTAAATTGATTAAPTATTTTTTTGSSTTGSSLAELQAGATAILKHIVPDLLAEGIRETARGLLASLASVLVTSQSVADSQQIRDTLADWIQRVSDLVGTPVADALRAESTSPALATTATTTPPSTTVLTPAQVVASFLTTPLPGNGGDNWTARVPANIQAQINANGGVFTGYATLLTQVPRDLNDTNSFGFSSVWFTGPFVGERSAQMVDYRDEYGNLVYTNPTLDPVTGLPTAVLGQPNVFFQMGINYSDSGASVGGFQGIGIVDPSLAGWAQAPTLCLDEVKEVLTQGLKGMGIPDALIQQALESCYKYDPAFGVLIPEGIGEAAMQLYQSRHGDWYDAVFEAIPALIVCMVAPQLVGLVAPALTGVAAAVVSAGVAGGINAAMNGGDFLTGVLTGMVAAYGGALAGDWTSSLGQLGSRAASAMVSNAAQQFMSNGKIDMRSLFAAGVGAGLTVELSKLPNLPQWASAGLGAAAASLALTGGDASAAAAAFLVAAGQSVATSGTTTTTGATGTSATTGVGTAPGDGVLEIVTTFNGQVTGYGSGTLTQLPDGTYVITTANHLFVEEGGLLVDPNTGLPSFIGEGGHGLSVMVNGVPIPIPMDQLISDMRIGEDGTYQYGTPRSNVANDALAIMLPPGWVADNMASLALNLPLLTAKPLELGERVTFAGYPGEVDENGNRPFATATGTIIAIRPEQGIFVRWTIDEYNAAVAGGMSGGKVYNAAGELVGIFNGEVKHVGNDVIGVFVPVRLDADGNILVGLGQALGGGSSGGGGQGH